MGRSLGSVSVLELAERYPQDFFGLIIESGFSDEEPMFKLIGTTATQAGFKREDGLFIKHNRPKPLNPSGQLKR